MPLLKLLVYFALSLLWASGAYSQDIDLEKRRAHLLFSPFHTIYYHHYQLQPEQYQPNLAALTLSPNYPYTSADQRRALAIQLKQILDGNGLFVDYAHLPKDNNYLDSLTRKSRYTPFPKFPEIYLEKINGQWFYSAATVAAIPRLHEQTFPFETDQLARLLALKTQDSVRFWGLTWGHYLGLLLLVIIPLLLHSVLVWLVGMLFRGLVRFTDEQLRERKARRISHPVSLFLVFYLLDKVIPILQFPAQLSYYLITAVRLSLPVFATIASIGLINLLVIYLQNIVRRHSNVWYEQLIPFLQTVLKIFVSIIGFLYMLNVLGVNVVAVLAGLSIGGLAVALAAQDTIKNFFGSVMIFIDRPFKVGDWIVAEGIDGDVEAIGVRSTRIRTFYDSLLHVPNGKLADMTIDNLGLRVYRRYRTMLNVEYNTPAPVLRAFVQGLTEIVLRHPHTRKDFYGIRFFEYGSHSLNILFNIFFTVPSINEEWAMREDLNFKILGLAHALGVRFAYPTQTIHVDTQSVAPEYVSSEAALAAKLEEFLAQQSLQHATPTPPASQGHSSDSF